MGLIIKTMNKNELFKFVKEDAKANKISSIYDYYFKLFYGNVNACVFRYLKVLRKYEYYDKKGGILKYYYRYRHRQLGLKYNLAIPVNKVGYGLYIPHVEGGGLLIVKAWVIIVQ